MNKNDRIEAKFLVDGDRFHMLGDKNKKVLEIVDIDKSGLKYNDVTPSGRKIWMFDKTLDPYKIIVFIRHREPIA